MGSSGTPPLPAVRLGAGTAWSVVMQFATAAVNIIVGILVSRALGPDGKGTLSIIQQTVAILLIIGDLGIGLAAVYYISKSEVRPGTVLGNALVALAAVSGAAFLVMLVLFRSPLAVVELSRSYTLAAFGLFVVSLAMSWVGSIAVGVLGVKGLARPSIVASLLSLGLICGAWYLGGGSALVVLLASTAGVAVGVALAMISVSAWLRPVEVSASAFRLMRRYSAKLYLATTADYLHFRQDVLMLGWMAGVGSAGVYSVGVSVAEIATRLPSAMSAAIQAQASRVSHESALDLSARAIRLTMVFSVLVVGLLAAVASWAIPFLFGEAFRDAVLVFYLLIPGVLASSLVWPISSYQSARGKVYWGVSMTSVGLNVVLNLVLIGPLGYYGAAVSSSISYTVLVVWLIGRLRADTSQGAAVFLIPRSEDFRILVDSASSYLRRG